MKERTLPAHHPIEIHVGARLRQRRTLLGMSQTQLAASVGLTFQQIQKYERGTNRVAASRLCEFAAVLRVPVAFFFDELPQALSGRGGRKKASPTTGRSDSADMITKRETLQLVRAYYKIANRSVRNRIRETVKALGATL